MNTNLIDYTEEEEEAIEEAEAAYSKELRDNHGLKFLTCDEIDERRLRHYDRYETFRYTMYPKSLIPTDKELAKLYKYANDFKGRNMTNSFILIDDVIEKRKVRRRIRMYLRALYLDEESIDIPYIGTYYGDDVVRGDVRDVAYINK